MSKTTFSGPVASQNGFVAPTFTSTTLPYFEIGNIVYVSDLNTLAFGGVDQWYDQSTGTGLGTGGQGGGGGTVQTFKYYMNGDPSDFTYYLASAYGGSGPGASSIQFDNLDSYPTTIAALEAMPIGTVIEINAGNFSLPVSFTLVSKFTGGAGSWSATTTTTSGFMGPAMIQYFTATY